MVQKLRRDVCAWSPLLDSGGNSGEGVGGDVSCAVRRVLLVPFTHLTRLWLQKLGIQWRWGITKPDVRFLSLYAVAPTDRRLTVSWTVKVRVFPPPQ